MNGELERSDAVRRLLGAIVGGALGVIGYWLLLEQRQSLLVLVGAGVALGAGIAARRRSWAWGAVMAVVAFGATLVTAWAFHRHADDPSFATFVARLGELPWRTQASLVAAALMGLWFGSGRPLRRRRAARES